MATTLEQQDVRSWDRNRCEEETRTRLGRVDEIRSEAGGSLAGVTDPERQEEIRDSHAELNVIGERLDQIRELEAADEDAQRLEAEVNRPSGYRPGATGEPRQTDRRDAGSLFAGSPAIEAFRTNRQKDIESEVPLGALLPEHRGFDATGYRPPMQAATLGEDSALADVDTQYPPESVRVGVLVDQLFQQPNIASLMPQTGIDQAAVPFMRETVNSIGAAETAEGALAPEASITFTEDSAPVRKIPVMLPVTEEILEDEGLVRGHVNGRLPLFVRLREDQQILNGNGTAPNLQGILGLSGIDATQAYSIGGATGQDKLEAIFSATIRVSENFLLPDAAVTGLAFWEEIRLAKDSNGQYLIAPASDQAAPRVWGTRVVTNQNMPAEAAGNTPALVGAFAQSSQVWRRRAITLAVSDSHEDNFGRGILVVKATTRLAVTHYRPAGYAVVTSNA